MLNKKDVLGRYLKKGGKNTGQEMIPEDSKSCIYEK